MSEVPKIIEDFLKGNNDAGGTIASLEEKAKRLAAKIEELETSKGIDQRTLAYSIATKSCEVLGVNITAEKLWSLVEAIQPILESGLTKRVPDAPKPFVNHCIPVNGVHAPFCNGDHSARG